MNADRMGGGTPTGSVGQPDPKPPAANSPAVWGAARTALVQIIDGQIAARRAELDDLTRIRRIVVGDGQMSTG